MLEDPLISAEAREMGSAKARFILQVPFIQFCYSAFRRGTVISAALSWSPMSSDCAFIPAGCSVSSRYTFPMKGLARRYLSKFSVARVWG